jgi:hypothetical protein
MSRRKHTQHNIFQVTILRVKEARRGRPSCAVCHAYSGIEAGGEEGGRKFFRSETERRIEPAGTCIMGVYASYMTPIIWQVRDAN